jgi:hypothetical protein
MSCFLKYKMFIDTCATLKNILQQMNIYKTNMIINGVVVETHCNSNISVLVYWKTNIENNCEPCHISSKKT